MHRFPVPKIPSGFDKAVKKSIAAIKRDINNGNAPTFDERVWKKFAAEVAAATLGKCGFCEILALSGTDPDVEHFYPKSAVSSLSDNPRDWGKEIDPSLARIKGRKPKRLSDRGYHWRAYEFANYLLSCHLCNRKYKLTIFPVLEGSKRHLPPKEGEQETPLILNPFVGPHPAEHLTFDDLGAVAPYNSSPYGHETIKTCGLNRNGLRGSREEKAWDVHDAVRNFLAETSKVEQINILKRIYRWGDERYAHCGMVRAIFTQRTGIEWQELEKRLSSHLP